jgi:hypothetical protein
MKIFMTFLVLLTTLNAYAGAPNLVCENETGTVALLKENGEYPMINLYKELKADNWTLPAGLYTRTFSPVDRNDDILTICNEGYYLTASISNKPGYTTEFYFVCRVDSGPVQVIHVADVNCWD